MITIYVDGFEIWYEETQSFQSFEPRFIRMEHSLAAIAKWEGKWKKPYMSTLEMYAKTPEEQIDYFRCMMLDDVDPRYINHIPTSELKKLQEYMEDTHTAARFSDKPGKGKKMGLSKTGEDITAETVYYQMTQLNIPFECENWNVNRLLSLINYCAKKQQPPDKMSEKEVIRRNAELNKIRQAKSKMKK